MADTLDFLNNPHLQKLNQIIVNKLKVNETEITYDASFTHDLGADSLDMIELFRDCEKEFDIIVRDKDTNGLNTVEKLLNYITKCKAMGY